MDYMFDNKDKIDAKLKHLYCIEKDLIKCENHCDEHWIHCYIKTLKMIHTLELSAMEFAVSKR